MARVVTLLGGESTGKTSLALALSTRLNSQGLAVCVVAEHLRQWCEQQGRAPHAHEQNALAREQARLIDQAAERGGVALVVADTAPLVVAAYSELYFADTGLLREAGDWQRRVDLTLLMGLDLPWVADGFFRDRPAIRDATDAVLRRELHANGTAFQTIHGQGHERSDRALRAIGRLLGRADLFQSDPVWTQGRRPWNCEKCSDPDCEQRLFSGLVASEKPGKGVP